MVAFLRKKNFSQATKFDPALNIPEGLICNYSTLNYIFISLLYTWHETTTVGNFSGDFFSQGAVPPPAVN